jgi:two-component sensor histidine kinase
LIVAELLSNSIKHAFPDRRAGSIAISMRQSADGLTISVSDDGIGLLRGLELAQAHSLGLQTIGILITQLAATLAVTSEKGTHFQIVIPNAIH